MPNWVTNELITLDQESMRKIVELMGGDDFEFDFNKIIQMPKEVVDDGWYAWSCNNWGTKWNACEAEVCGDDLIIFQTAWSTPYPVLQELSRKLGIEIKVRYADEDIGQNVGEYSFKNGVEVKTIEILEGSKEAYELAFNITGGEDNFVFSEETGTYEYNEED